MVVPNASSQAVVVLVENDRITLVGAVPSQAAGEAVVALAVATSLRPDLPVDNQLTVDASVPADAAVRLLEFPSLQFAEGATNVAPSQIPALDRIVATLIDSPGLRVEVVGHTDQRGDEEVNLVLSQQRADEVVAYIAGQGVDPGRLSADGAGEDDLFTAGDDPESLELNRRVEFVFFGVFTAPIASPSTAVPG